MGEEILVVAFNSRVFGLDARTGTRLWSYADVIGTPRLAVRDGRVYALGGNLVALDQKTGALLWQQVGLFQSADPTLLLEGDRLYLGGRGKAYCYTIEGQLLWEEGFKGQGVGAVSLAFPGNAAQADETH